jgi:hypothetical protein
VRLIEESFQAVGGSSGGGLNKEQFSQVVHRLSSSERTEQLCMDGQTVTRYVVLFALNCLPSTVCPQLTIP